MCSGVVLEHIVPHTDSLLAVIMTSANNEVFRLKYEFSAHVEGEGPNRRINISLDRKIVAGGVSEVSLLGRISGSAGLIRPVIRQ